MRTERRGAQPGRPSYRVEVRELVGVEHRPHGDDDAVRDLERGHPERSPIALVEDEPRLAVDARPAMDDAALVRLPPPSRSAPSRRARRRPAAPEWREPCRPVTEDGGVRGEELDQLLGVALLPGGDEAACDLFPLQDRALDGESFWRRCRKASDSASAVSACLTLAAAIGATPPRRVPRWLVRRAAGEVGVVLMTEARGASNRKAKEELGWTLRHPSWRQGFAETYRGTA